PPVGSEGPGFTPASDERRLWDEAKEEERKLRDKVPLYQDPILEDYLNQVARRLEPPELQGQSLIRIRVTSLRDPTLNAFTFPTGSIYVHTGLLARLENEAQLAVVLGHEMTHATNRHALEFTRSARNKAMGFSIAAIAASILVAEKAGEKANEGDWESAYVINQVANIVVGLGLQLAFVASVNGFGRDLEREADEVGLQRVAAAGYDPRQAPRVFEILKDDHGDDRKVEVFFFGSHPRLDERIADMKELLSTRYSGVESEGRTTDTRAFRMRMRVLVRDDAAENIRLGRLGNAEAEIGRVLDLTPNDPVAYYLSGQIAEKRTAETKDRTEADRQRDTALEAYDKAIKLDSRYADPYRAIGILRLKNGDKEKARTAFERYLELRPEAPDSQQIKDYLLEIAAG
ncbi:MAG TPA: M48 family metalloprotease, partial [Candidatus Polarisedimenticolia bacterium]|nr:M48 family metalloprotease [Candidatus Polarisedimenticolia bacterium]